MYWDLKKKGKKFKKLFFANDFPKSTAIVKSMLKKYTTLDGWILICKLQRALSRSDQNNF